MKDQIDLLDETLARDGHAWAQRASARERGSKFHSSSDEQMRLESCAKERIHLIGSIQSFGQFLALHQGTVVAASTGLASWLNQPLRELHPELDEAVQSGDFSGLPRHLAIEDTNYAFVIYESNNVYGHDDRGLPATAPDELAVSPPEITVVELEPVEGAAATNVSLTLHAIHTLSELHGDAETMRTAVKLVREATGYDRVLAYRFFEDGHGQVIADEHPEDMESYLGLHFPASDIPEQARELFRRKLSRMIVDTEDPGNVILRSGTDNFDLSSSELRMPSVHHLQFMRNMGQRATLTLSLMHRGQLIGMITCAHRSPRRVSIEARRQLEILARVAASHIAGERQAARLKHQLESKTLRIAIVAPIFSEEPLHEILTRAKDSILNLVPSDGMMLCLGGQIFTIGRMPPKRELQAVIELLGTDRLFTDSVSRDFPEAAEHLPGIEGLIVVPLLSEGDCLLFCRSDAVRDVLWLGDQTPENRVAPLSPRNSFSLWRESVRGRSTPWGGVVEEAFELGDDICIALQARENAKLAKLAYKDTLTGLPNRRYLEEQLEQAITDLESTAASGSIAAIFIDLNDFKTINDDHGHEIGDAILVTVGQRLSHATREGDVAARLAGDEFVVVCYEVNEREAGGIAQRFAATLSAPVHIGDLTVPVSVSVGYAIGDGTESSVELLSRADSAMYRNKRNSKRGE